MIEIQLSSRPEQLFSVVLNGAKYDIRVTLNSRTGVWSIGFSKQGVSIVQGIALLGGRNILAPYNLPFNNAYIVSLNNLSLDPTKTNLGTEARLFILEDDELDG